MNTLDLIKEKEKEFEDTFKNCIDLPSKIPKIKSHNRSTIISILESLREEIGEDIELKHEECAMGTKEMCDICIGRTITNDERQRMRNHLTTIITNLKE